MIGTMQVSSLRTWRPIPYRAVRLLLVHPGWMPSLSLANQIGGSSTSVPSLG